MIKLIWLASIVFAAPPENSLLLEPPPAQVAAGATLHFKAKPTYHFNAKAPQTCGAEKVKVTAPAEAECTFRGGGEQKISLKICDDHETFCRNEDFAVRGGDAAAPVAAASTLKISHKGLPGFVTNDPEAAVAQARREGKLLFIDFFGEWCPPCRWMEDRVLMTPTFLKATVKGFVRAGLDVDLPPAKAWESHFDVHAFPTYIVADADLNEIGRFVGSCPPPAFLAWLHKQESFKGQPLMKEGDVTTAPVAMRMRVAEAALDARAPDKALTALKGLTDREALYLTARARALLVKGKAGEAPKVYAEIVPQFDGGGGGGGGSGAEAARPAALEWVGDWMKPNPAGDHYPAFVALVDRLKTSPLAEREGYDEAGLYEVAGDLLEGTPKAAESKRFYGMCADAFAKQGASRGVVMSRARCLSEAERYDEVAKLMLGMAKTNPREYVFNRTAARALMKTGHLPKALAQVSLAEKKAQGDILFHIVELKGRILLAQGKKPEALAVASAAMARIDALPALEKAGALGAYEDLQKLAKDSR